MRELEDSKNTDVSSMTNEILRDEIVSLSNKIEEQKTLIEKLQSGSGIDSTENSSHGETIKEQNSKIELIEAENIDLKKKVEALEHKLENVEKWSRNFKHNFPFSLFTKIKPSFFMSAALNIKMTAGEGVQVNVDLNDLYHEARERNVDPLEYPKYLRMRIFQFINEENKKKRNSVADKK